MTPEEIRDSIVAMFENNEISGMEFVGLLEAIKVELLLSHFSKEE